MSENKNVQAGPNADFSKAPLPAPLASQAKRVDGKIVRTVVSGEKKA